MSLPFLQMVFSLDSVIGSIDEWKLYNLFGLLNFFLFNDVDNKKQFEFLKNDHSNEFLKQN